MSLATIHAIRPASDEHHPYFGTYIALVPETEVIPALESQMAEMVGLLRGLTEAQGGLRYAPDKWSVRGVVAHVIDSERVFAYRALRFARGDRSPLAGFDENAYAPESGADARTLRSLADEFELLRRANLEMFRGFPAEAWTRRGEANGNEVSVRALAFILAGHARHHTGLVRERYLV